MFLFGKYPRKSLARLKISIPDCLLIAFLKLSHKGLQFHSEGVNLDQGPPTPGPQTSTGWWLVRNQAAQQDVSGQEVSETSSVLQLLPTGHITTWALPPVKSAVALDSHRSMNPTVNCTCAGSMLLTPYDNYSKTIPPPLCLGKTFFHELVPDVKTVADCWFRLLGGVVV